MPEPDTEGRQLGDFYNIHYGQAHCLTYFGRAPKTLKARELKGVQQIFLELVIDVQGVRPILYFILHCLLTRKSSLLHGRVVMHLLSSRE